MSFKIVFSGQLSSESNVFSLLQSKGISVDSMLGKSTKCLVIGSTPKQNKIEDAQLLGIPIVSERNFTKFLEGKGKIKSDLDVFSNIQSEVVSPPNKKRKRVEPEEEKIKKIKTKKLPAELNGRIIALEGNIGAGKSTLSLKIRNQYELQCSIYEEQTNEEFLKLFYSDTAKYGFAFQWGMLKTRIFQLKMAQYDKSYQDGKFRMWDRSMMGDYVFALWNHLLGGISKREIAVYESEFGGSLTNIQKWNFASTVDAYIFLNDEPSSCKFRVENKRGNASESNIPLPYYEGIDDIHFTMLLALLESGVSTPVVMNWGEYDDLDNVLERLAKLISGETRRPSLKYELKKPKISEKVIELDTEKDVEAYYQDIALKNEKVDSQIAVVKSSIMQISPKTKNVVEENCKNYSIKFWKNSYKRVVMFLISRGCSITFYES